MALIDTDKNGLGAGSAEVLLGKPTGTLALLISRPKK